MDIDSLANGIVYCQEEQDFLEWSKNSGNLDIHLGDKFKYHGKKFIIVGGTIEGYIFCQILKPFVHKVRFSKSEPKMNLNYSICKRLLDEGRIS